jgi:phosphatidylserine/phosphatidylglycerophosphate/cardiolipin synthase-like enzyme
MSRAPLSAGAAMLLALLAIPAGATQLDVRLEIHYAPEERLDMIDEALIASAKTSIDLASYSLTDPVVIDALNAAALRGVRIRIVLDPRERHDFARLSDLADTVRIKRGGPFMHLKSYVIDSATLRTGSANFSTSGENAQDNDLIVIRDGGGSADAFEAHFTRIWSTAQPMIEFDPAINALEPR